MAHKTFIFIFIRQEDGVRKNIRESQEDNIYNTCCKRFAFAYSLFFLTHV